MSLHLTKATFLLGLALTSSLCSAQGVLRDPTMPPPGAGLPGAGMAAIPEAANAVPAVQIKKLGPAPRMTDPDGRPLKTGAQVGAWRVVRVTASGVVLQSGSGSQTLSATPSVKKKVVDSPAAATRSKNGNP